MLHLFCFFVVAFLICLKICKCFGYMQLLQIDKTRVFKITGSLMKVESIAGAFSNPFDLHKAIIGLENQFWSSF